MSTIDELATVGEGLEAACDHYRESAMTLVSAIRATEQCVANLPGGSLEIVPPHVPDFSDFAAITHLIQVTWSKFLDRADIDEGTCAGCGEPIVG